MDPTDPDTDSDPNPQHWLKDTVHASMFSIKEDTAKRNCPF